MPISENGTYFVPQDKTTLDLSHENGSSISIVVFPGSVGSDPSEALGDEAAQDLVNHLAAWEKLSANGVSSVRSRTYNYAITPDGEE